MLCKHLVYLHIGTGLHSQNGKAQAEAEAQRKAEEEIRKAEERIRDEVKAAPTACQPAHPVDVWGRTLTIRVHGEEDCEAVLEFLQAAKIEYQEV